MNGEQTNRPQHTPTRSSSRAEDGLRRMFFDGLPTMAALVTMIAQPFAQDTLRSTLQLPDWLPIIVAIAVSGLLAMYKMKVVRRAGRNDCVICVPILMLVIFSAYAGGNNFVYYLKEGYTRPATSSLGSTEELTALKQERDILQKQLENAEELIETLRGTLRMPESTEGKQQSSPSLSMHSAVAALKGFIAAEAHAQGSTPESRDRRREDTLGREQLQGRLKKYDEEQRELNRRREEVKQEREKNQTTQPKPLIKSW
jgi:hypothetical protein